MLAYTSGIGSSFTASVLKGKLLISPQRSPRFSHFALYFQSMDLTFIVQAGRGISLHVDQPQCIALDDEQPATFEAAAKNNILDTTQMVVFLITGQRKDVYDTMKQFCCLSMPIPSQALLLK